jgi:hypothetical protein
LIIPGRPSRWPSSGEKIRTPAAASQALDLLRHDDAAAPAEYPDLSRPGLRKQLGQVLEVLQVAALVRADGHALGVLVEYRVDDLAHGPVVAEVNNLGPLGLHDPPHDVDRRVVPVEQRRRGDEPHRVRRHVQLASLCRSWHRSLQETASRRFNF